MPQITVKITDTKLKGIITSMPKVGNYICEAAAVNAFNEARRIVPVDTGALRASIYYRIKGAAAWVGATMHYALYVEYGTRNPNYPAQPYLRPAVAQVPWLKIIRAAFARIGL